MYYHINNNPNCVWRRGDVIPVGLEDNYMWRSYAENGDFIELEGKNYTSDIIIRHAVDVYTNQHSIPVPMKYYHFNRIRTLIEANDSLGHSLKIVRELAFESIRKEFFPQLPSRQKCIWLIPDHTQSIDFWRKTLHSKTQKIFKVDVEGKIHRAAQKWLVGGTFGVNETKANAHKYWGGVDIGSIEDELLFAGKVTILEELTGQDFYSS